MTPRNASGDETANPQTDRGRVTATPWIPLDPETDRGEHGLTPLILHRLSHTVNGKEVTIAQVLAQSLLDRALDGHFGAFEEILMRIDGDAKSRDPAARSVKTSFEIDHVKAQRVLDALSDERDGPPGN